MAETLAIAEAITTVRQVEETLGLRLADDPRFFTEWMDADPPIDTVGQERLEEIRRNYLYQSSDGFLLEETIKIVVLSPLLELAGFYQAPYKFRAEVPVNIETIADNDQILRGRIDALVLQDALWIVLIESKKTTVDLELAIPQTLAYMAANPAIEQPFYSMVTNGSSYLFMKTLNKHYDVSDIFSTRSLYRNNLTRVLQILKHLGQLIIHT